MDSLQIVGNRLFKHCRKSKGVAFLAVDPALGVRSGTTSGAVVVSCSSPRLDALDSIHLFVFGNIAIVDLALEVEIGGFGSHRGVKFSCGSVLNDSGGASSADTTKEFARDGNVVVVHDDGWAAHFD